MLAATASLPNSYAPPAGEVRPSLTEANRWCQQFTRKHAENFIVASWLLPRYLRQPFANLYAWCRWADNLSDETGDVQKSLRQLADWESQLHGCLNGETNHPIYVALAETIRQFELPLQPFADLLAAFRQDQQRIRYETIDELLNYCRLSANPVGRLVLALGRCDNAVTQLHSDAICTGLQLVNFWQDVRCDWSERGRIYLPSETMQSYGITEADIDRGSGHAAFRAAIASEVERAEAILRSGWPLVALVSPELRIEVELFLRGGLATAEVIRRRHFDVLSQRPAISRAKKFRLFATTVLRQKLLRRYGADG